MVIREKRVYLDRDRHDRRVWSVYKMAYEYLAPPLITIDVTRHVSHIFLLLKYVIYSK